MDTVKLKKAFCGLPTGTIGTIVFKYEDECFEVEYLDKNNNSIEIITTPKDFLELVQC